MPENECRSTGEGNKRALFERLEGLKNWNVLWDSSSSTLEVGKPLAEISIEMILFLIILSLQGLASNHGDERAELPVFAMGAPLTKDCPLK
jgi:hypothetical protein